MKLNKEQMWYVYSFARVQVGFISLALLAFLFNPRYLAIIGAADFGLLGITLINMWVFRDLRVRRR